MKSNPKTNIIKIKRVYDDYSKDDGYRILIDRLWPRGISKERAHIDSWIKEVSPSNDLRRWYSANSQKTKQFQEKYLLELKEKSNALDEIKKTIKNQKITTLLYASKTSEPIHALILQHIFKN